VLTKVWKSRVF